MCKYSVDRSSLCVCTQHHSSSILDKSPLFCHDSEICTRLCFCKRLVLSHDFVLLTFRLACSMHSLLGGTPCMLDFLLASQWIYTLILLNKSNDATKSDRKLESCFCAPTTNVDLGERRPYLKRKLTLAFLLQPQFGLTKKFVRSYILLKRLA